MPAKKALRKEMRLVLSNLDKRWVQTASLRLSQHLTGWLKSRFPHRPLPVLGFMAYFPGEVSLEAFYASTLGERHLFLPKVNEDLSMEFVRYNGVFEAGRMGGIPEPRSDGSEPFDERFWPQVVVVVPGLAFDKTGGRLGRGKGYYDRFLGTKSHKTELIKVGACWELQLVNECPKDSYDVDMDVIITEEGVRYDTVKGRDKVE